MGEDVPGFGAIRDMQDPTAFGDPDRMTSNLYYTDSGDNGGVHFNSGVNNKAVYLTTDGGTFNGVSVTGLGIPKIAKIYYEAQTNLLTSGSDYADLYDDLYQACLNLVGTAGITNGNCTQVRNATNAVEMNQQPVPGFNPEAKLCPSGQPINTVLFTDNMEGANKWTFNTLSGSNSWSYTDFYATSGIWSLWSPNIETTSDAVAAMTSAVTLPAGAFLHFRHAFGFEFGPTDYWDGSVLEYSANNGPWIDMGSLFVEGRDYSGTISTNDTNPLAGREGFVAESHGYVSSRYNLNSLAGKNVRIRFRLGTDSITWGPLGWAVDDVQIYTCGTASATHDKIGVKRG